MAKYDFYKNEFDYAQQQKGKAFELFVSDYCVIKQFKVLLGKKSFLTT